MTKYLDAHFLVLGRFLGSEGYWVAACLLTLISLVFALNICSALPEYEILWWIFVISLVCLGCIIKLGNKRQLKFFEKKLKKSLDFWSYQTQLSQMCICISFWIFWPNASLALTSILDIFGFRGNKNATNVDHNVLMMNNQEMASATDLD